MPTLKSSMELPGDPSTDGTMYETASPLLKRKKKAAAPKPLPKLPSNPFVYEILELASKQRLSLIHI